MAQVLDLYGGIGGYCESDGTAWVPRRRDATATRTISLGGSLVLKPLVDCPIQILKGSIGAGLTLQLTVDTKWAWSGCPFRIVNQLTGLGGLKVLGKLLGAAWVDLSFDGTAFQITGTAGLL